jgi:DNA replicative helicase MCM subunit Mcm2 (Cdc46/Mcm family)
VSSHYDQHLTCSDCGHDFVWTAKEQEFFRENGYQPPKRCKDCRRAKKEQRGEYDRRGDGNR